MDWSVPVGSQRSAGGRMQGRDCHRQIIGGVNMQYALKGKRQGFEIKRTDDVNHKPDGYTEVRRNGAVVGVYLTSLLAQALGE